MNEDIQTFLVTHPDWTYSNDQLIAVYEFPRFLAAIAVINAVAVSAEELQHHPVYTHNYRTVTFRLSTHDVGNKVTSKDIALATKISAIVQLSLQQ